jgi:hypothetical protein
MNSFAAQPASSATLWPSLSCQLHCLWPLGYLVKFDGVPDIRTWPQSSTSIALFQDRTLWFQHESQQQFELRVYGELITFDVPAMPSGRVNGVVCTRSTCGETVGHNHTPSAVWQHLERLGVAP